VGASLRQARGGVPTPISRVAGIPEIRQGIAPISLEQAQQMIRNGESRIVFLTQY
jgi:hypothetical protein